MIIGIGTDIVEIERIRHMIERHGDHFLNRCFTQSEIEYANRHRDSAVRFAGRWAAKEAVVKVLGTGFVQGITFHDIEVVSLHTGQPTVKLSGEALQISQQLLIAEIKLTISHAREYATATAIGVSGTLPQT
jgi:holo-[acyl-carrier protein] synthase